MLSAMCVQYRGCTNTKNNIQEMSKKHVQVTTAVAEITLSNKTKGKEIEMVKLKKNEKGLGK